MRIPVLLPLCLLLATLCGGQAAPSYVLVDNETGYILGGSGQNDKRQIASLTKVATALVALDWAQITKADISQLAPVSAQALAAGGQNPVGLQAGDMVSVRDLIYCSLIASDNIAATALAEYVGGHLPNSQGLSPIDNFVANMNALARSLSMKHTLYLNPSGLDSNTEGSLPYSTPSDLARLTRYAYSGADFPFYVAQKERVVHVIRGGSDLATRLQNTNDLLGQDGVDGVKTGRTARAGDCVILTSEQRPDVVKQGDTTSITPRRIILVLLDSSDRFGQGSSLLRQGWGLYDRWAANGRRDKHPSL